MSNFNETEQFIALDGPDSKGTGGTRGDIRASYVQVRGSVPLYWAEVNNLRYKPDLVIMDLNATVSFTSATSQPLRSLTRVTYARWTLSGGIWSH